MPDLLIQIVNAQGVVEFDGAVTQQELKDAHEQSRCDAWCAYCYTEADEWKSKQ